MNIKVLFVAALGLMAPVYGADLEAPVVLSGKQHDIIRQFLRSDLREKGVEDTLLASPKSAVHLHKTLIEMCIAEDFSLENKPAINALSIQLLFISFMKNAGKPIDVYVRERYARFKDEDVIERDFLEPFCDSAKRDELSFKYMAPLQLYLDSLSAELRTKKSLFLMAHLDVEGYEDLVALDAPTNRFVSSEQVTAARGDEETQKYFALRFRLDVVKYVKDVVLPLLFSADKDVGKK